MRQINKGVATGSLEGWATSAGCTRAGRWCRVRQVRTKNKANTNMENISKKDNEPNKSDKRRDHDAWSGWGAVIGFGAGLLVGSFFGQALVTGFLLGALGWLAGAFVDRSRY